MALVKTPDGGWFVDDNEFIVNYQENSVKLKNPGGGGGSGEEIPVPTAEDEGKILAIVNGKYTLVDIQVIKG